MSYKSLYRLYLMNNDDVFSNIYKNRFNSDSTIKFDLYINDYQSFFYYDKEIMALVASIRDYDYRINEIFSSFPDIAKEEYTRKSLIDEVEYTNQIEGVVSTRKDINDLIKEIENKSKAKNRFEGIVNKYFLLNKEELEINNSSDIRKIYDEMLINEIEAEDKKNIPDGRVFRKDTVNVYSTSGNVIHEGLFPEAKIVDYMDKAIDILNNSSIDILIRVSLFHYFFGFIHPFYDGNGRLNRFISSYVLSKHFNDIIGFRLSMTIKENLSQYYDAFKFTNDIRNRADISTFVYEFLCIILESYKKTEIYALNKSRIFKKYDDILSSISVFDKHKDADYIRGLLFILIQASIFGDFGLTKADICKIMKKGNTKVSSYLSELRRYDFCEEARSGKSHYFKANLEEMDKYEN